jgi:16S rRNA (cytosine1402-N4)-methyltransferase
MEKQEATFYHETVMLKEAVAALEIKGDGVYVDATFGGGGHSREIMTQLSEHGKLISFDQDEDAWVNKIVDERFIAVSANFKFLKRFLKFHQVDAVDGILADLGVSSFQFDTAERGFSIRFDGPMDMRMDKRTTLTAEHIVTTYSEAALHLLFERYGEVRNSKQLAKVIVEGRVKVKLHTIENFKTLISSVVMGNPHKYLAQVFQALRIEVNDEMGVLRSFLEQCVECLKPGGVLSVITFHSLEDRIVKQFMKCGFWEEERDSIYGTRKAILMKPLGKATEPSEAEQKRNSRSRSAKLRIAKKI